MSCSPDKKVTKSVQVNRGGCVVGRHAGIVMPYWLGLALILVCLTGFSPVVLFSNQAFATGGDDFNDNSKDLTKWGRIS